jgi:hypothetical protein
MIAGFNDLDDALRVVWHAGIGNGGEETAREGKPRAQGGKAHGTSLAEV